MPKKGSLFDKAAGERLRRCRLFLGLSQKDFAASLEISRTALENAESGDNSPQPEAVELARKAYGITHDWIYGGNAYLLPPDMKKAVVVDSKIADHQPGERKRAKG